MPSQPTIRAGTTAFTAEGWERTFYPADVKPGEAIRHYAAHFDTVEVDSTFYRVPSAETTQGWHDKTPEGFIFAAKVPRTITHDKVLVDCERELWEFLAAMDPLGKKLGPLVLQFPYFNKKKFSNPEDFFERLQPFLRRLPKAYQYVVEVRNKYWLRPPLMEMLSEHNVALGLVAHPWMPKPDKWTEKADPVTADFTYVRWIGDRKTIEEQTRTWDKTIVDRTDDMKAWVTLLRELASRVGTIFAFANNRYAGHAPDTVRLFQKLWGEK